MLGLGLAKLCFPPSCMEESGHALSVLNVCLCPPTGRHYVNYHGGRWEDGSSLHLGLLLISSRSDCGE